jgi:gas vesicle protein
MRFILGFLLGMLVGASIALALAPQPGSETRGVIIERVRERRARRHGEATFEGDAPSEGDEA